MGGLSDAAKDYAARYFGEDARGVQIVLEANVVRLSDGATVTLYASILPVKHTGGALPCEPRLMLGSLRQRCYNPSWGEQGGNGIYDFRLFNTPSVDFGGFALYNADGELNSWAENYNWHNAECVLKIGEQADAYANYEELWHFRVRSDPGFEADLRQGSGVLSFEVKLALANFDEPISTAVIAETQRIEPRVFGEVNHARAELVEAATQLYAMDRTDEDITTPINAFEGGAPINSQVGNPPPLGPITLVGEFSLTATPAYDVTFYGTSPPAPLDIPGVVTDLFDELSVTATEVGSNFNSSTRVGVFINQDHNYNVSQAVNIALGPRGMWWVHADGMEVSFRRVDPPSEESIGASVAFTDPISVQRDAVIPPIHHHLYRQTRYWHQPSTIIVEDTAEVDRLSNGGQFSEYNASPIAYPHAIAVETHDVGFSVVGSSSDLDLTELIAKPGSICRFVPNPTQALDAWLGDYVSLQADNVPFFDTARKMVLVGVELDFEARRVVLEGFVS